MAPYDPQIVLRNKFSIGYARKLKAAFLIMDVSTLNRLILEVSFQSRVWLPLSSFIITGAESSVTFSVSVYRLKGG